jgi:hypothetical protein
MTHRGVALIIAEEKEFFSGQITPQGGEKRGRHRGIGMPRKFLSDFQI